MKTTSRTNRLLGKPFIFAMALLLSSHMLMAQQIDLGIFSPVANQIELKIRPDFDITGDDFISELRYTVRWADPTLVITNLTAFAPYDIIASGAPELFDGYYYQTFIGNPLVQVGIPIAAGTEVLVSSFEYTAAPGAYVELINPPYPPFSNRDFYAEWNGQDRTGIFYYMYPAVPLSGWAIYLGIGLILAVMVVRLRKLV